MGGGLLTSENIFNIPLHHILKSLHWFQVSFLKNNNNTFFENERSHALETLIISSDSARATCCQKQCELNCQSYSSNLKTSRICAVVVIGPVSGSSCLPLSYHRSACHETFNVKFLMAASFIGCGGFGIAFRCLSGCIKTQLVLNILKIRMD